MSTDSEWKAYDMVKSRTGRYVVWTLAVVVSLIGIWVSLDLSKRHFEVSVQPKQTLFDKLCTASETTSCEKVSKSRWGMFPPLPAEENKTEQTSTTKPAGEGDGDDIAQPTQSKKEADKTPRVPTAELGLAFFTFIFAYLVVVGTASATWRWPHVVLLVGTLLGAAGSAWFEYIMWTQLEVWCPLCLVSHIASFLLPIFVLLLWPPRTERWVLAPATPASPVPPAVPAAASTSPAGDSLFAPMEDVPGRRAGARFVDRPSLAALAAALVIAILGVGTEHLYIQAYAKQNHLKVATVTSDYYKKKYEPYLKTWQHGYVAWLLMPKVEIPIEGRPVHGPADAKNTLVFFSDFECPACREVDKYIHQRTMPLAARYGGMRVVFKHYPLDEHCNATVKRGIHPMACEAAYAAEAAFILGGDGAFWKMHDLLYEHQKDWKKSKNFVLYARQIGLDEKQFVETMKGSAVLERIKQDIEDGYNLGSDLPEEQYKEVRVDNSTPVLFVNGRRLNGFQFGSTWRSIFSLETAIRSLFAPVLSQQSTTAPARQTPTQQPPAGHTQYGPRVQPATPVKPPGQRPAGTSP